MKDACNLITDGFATKMGLLSDMTELLENQELLFVYRLSRTISLGW